MSSTTNTTIKSKDRTSSSAGQKFWPLKKFGLHHGKTDDQPIALSTTVKSAIVNEPVKEMIEKDAQKKSKNKRLSSLLSSRRQEASIQNLQSHVNTPESIAADSLKRQSANASNTPTLTRKMGRDISRARINSQNNTANVPKNNNMTAKSAGSGTLSRSNTFNSAIFAASSQPNKVVTRTRELRNNSVRRSSEDKLLKRPQSPPKRNDSPTQPNIMLESVQQQIQLEQLLNDVDNDSAIEEDDYEEDPLKKDQITKLANKSITIEFDSPPIKRKSVAELKPDTKEEEEEEIKEDRKQLQSPSPAAAEFTGEQSALDTTCAAGIVSMNSEPVSPTMCTFDVQSVQNKLNESEKAPNNIIVQQQPIQRINRLRPAASFATLRQLASSNNTLQHQQQFSQQIPHIKRRPVSFIESSNNSNYASPASEDYLTVNRPAYYRRASSEDNRHIRQQSDNNSPIQYNNVGNRRLVRSNTVHNLIIKDGYGHRIVQCVGLDESAPLQQQPWLRRKNSSFESNDSYHDWSPPTEIMDDSLFSSRQQQLEEQHHQQQLLLIQQQQSQLMVQDNTDTSSSDSSCHQGISNRRIKRKDSAKSISSLCSTSPPITSYDAKFDKLKTKLDKERATVKALQKQKEACNKDVVFLSKNVEDLTTDNLEWKKKFENEKTLKERFQDDLSCTMDKLNEATEQLRQLETQTRLLKSEIDDKNKEIRELEKKKPRAKPITDVKSTDRLLAAQLQHSQNQVRLLKSTMEQFLRMGVFNDDLNSSNSITSPTISIDAVVSEFKRGRSKQQKRSGSKSPTTNSVTDETPNDNINSPPLPVSRSRKSLVPSEIVEPFSNRPTKTPEIRPTKTPDKKINPLQDEGTEELDTQLRELLREKELLQAEYSKAPSSGGNALVRRRREELESRLDAVDSQMCRIKLKMRSRNIL